MMTESVREAVVRRMTWLRTLFFSLLVLQAGCGGLAPAPAYPSEEDVFSDPQEIPLEGIDDDQPPPLVLHPGDALAVEVVSTQTTSIPNLLVDSQGNVHLPLAGDVPVGGLSLSQAQVRIQKAQREFDSLATVSLRISDRGGHRVTVLGAVSKQGVVTLPPAARLADVLAEAGGPVTQTTGSAPVVMADLSGAVLMRAGKRVPVSMEEAMRGDPRHNIYVRAGDHIYVPPALGNSISILGQVGGPVVFPHRPGLRLSEALAQAGGISVGGDKSDIRVIRGTLTKPRVYRASLRDLVDGDAHDVQLRPGDIVFVSDHFIEDLGEVLGIISPALSLGLTSVALALTLEGN